MEEKRREDPPGADALAIGAHQREQGAETLRSKPLEQKDSASEFKHVILFSITCSTTEE